MTWNYRVMYFPDAQEPYCAIHEVHYNKNGTLESYGENPAVVLWGLDEGEDNGPLILEKMQSAFTKQPLCPDDFDKKEG